MIDEKDWKGFQNDTNPPLNLQGDYDEFLRKIAPYSDDPADYANSSDLITEGENKAKTILKEIGERK